MNEKKRCSWCNLKNERYVLYHDREWGVPDFRETYLFEMLILESFQAGLSWECVLNKREAFKEAFAQFDIEKVSRFDAEKMRELAENKGIIRNRLKIAAAVRNAGIFKKIQEEFGGFYPYLRTFYDGNPIDEIGCTRSELSDRISEDLQKRGMKFVGTTIVYSYLQAIGIVRSHEPSCFLFVEGGRVTD